MVTKDPNKTALCFIRDIENLEDHLTDSTISRYIDTETNKIGEKVVDKEAKGLLEDLKNRKIPSKLNAETNIFNFKVIKGI
jgi:hypothetical protein